MSQSQKKGKRPRKPVEVTEADFSLKAYNATGQEGIVATIQVPNGVIWAPRPNAPVTVALVEKQSFTVTANTDNQTIDLNPNAPIVPYMDDPTAGQYTEDAYIVGYFDSTGNGTPDTRMTDTSTTHFNGTFTTSDGFVDSFEIDEAAGNTDVEFYVVQRQGYAYLQKRSAGQGNVTQKLQQETSIKWAFNTPNDPNSKKQITWDPRATGKRGSLPPKFRLDVVYFDNAEPVNIEDLNAVNLRIRLPLEQRALGSDESAREIRARVRNQMTQGN